METHKIEAHSHIQETLDWLDAHGCVGTTTGGAQLTGPRGDELPGHFLLKEHRTFTPVVLLFRPKYPPSAPPKMAMVGDTLVYTKNLGVIIEDPQWPTTV
jgi:hypothetical protein